MYSKIIVPLDGSVLAEKALPYAASLTKQLNATLVLLRIEEARPLVVNFSQAPQREAGNIVYSGNMQPNNRSPGVDGSLDHYQTITSNIEEQPDEDYLQKVKGTLVGTVSQTLLKAEQIQTRVVCGRSPKELAAIVEEEQADLIVMTTHGRSGLSLLLTGSVATKLIHNTNLPVILIKSDEMQGLEKAEKQAININEDPILVTLDGTVGSETILEAAANLAQQLGVKIHLFEVASPVMPSVVIPNMNGGLGGYYYLPDYDLDKESKVLQGKTEQYLHEIQARLRKKGVECLTVVQIDEPEATLEYNEEPLSKIIAYAKKVKAQLVAMTTHGRGRLGQLVLGSVAEEVVRQSHLPVMLIKNEGHLNHPDKS